MANATEVSFSQSPKTMNDATSLRFKEEIVAFDRFITKFQGETKKHF